MRILLYLQETETFLEDGSVPWQVWGDELQAMWLKSALVGKGHEVDVRGANIEIPKEKYDVAIYFQPTMPHIDADISVLWHQNAFCVSSALGGYDKYLTAFYGAYEELKDELDIIYFPSGIDLIERCHVENSQYPSDIVFIGGYAVRTSDCYEKYLDPLMDLGVDIKIYGNGGSSWADTKYAKYYQGKLEMTSKVNEVISGAKIMLSIHQNAHRADGMFSHRVLEGLSCGTLVVTDRIISLEKFFGNSMVFVDGGDDSRDKVKFFLEHEKERLAIVEEGSKQVRAFSLDNMVDRLLDFIGGI